MASVKAEEVSDTLHEEQIKKGLILRYYGDKVPYVQATHLIRKGKQTGMYMLPAFTSMNGVRSWEDTPGSTKDRYVVEEIETNRLSKKGASLPDLVIVRGEGYSDSVRFGFNPKDLCAKFGLLCDPDYVVTDIDGQIIEEDDKERRRLAWQEEVQNDGW